MVEVMMVVPIPTAAIQFSEPSSPPITFPIMKEAFLEKAQIALASYEEEVREGMKRIG